MLRAALLALLSAAAVVALAGCGDAPAQVTTQALDGTDWASSSIEGRELVKGSKLTLAFEDDRLSASAGCNSINGKYTLTAGVLKQADQVLAKPCRFQSFQRLDTVGHHTFSAGEKPARDDVQGETGSSAKALSSAGTA
jgi:hypothetical protein